MRSLASGSPSSLTFHFCSRHGVAGGLWPITSDLSIVASFHPYRGVACAVAAIGAK
jgi:hypothetical protein